MRILFLSNLYPPHEIGGYEQSCQEVAGCLQERGHDVRVLTSRYGVRRNAETKTNNGVTRSLHLQTDLEYYRPADFFVRRARQDRANIAELRKHLVQFGPDVLMVWGMWQLSLNLPYWAEQWMPGRVAYCVSSYWPTDPDPHASYWRLPARRRMTDLLKRPLRAWALAQLRREGYPPRLRLEHAVCCSQHVRDTLVQAGKLPASASVIYGGIDPGPFLYDTPVRTQTHEGPLRLLYFGRLIHDKGVHTAIEAIGLLKQRGLADRVALTILGSGHPEYERRLRAMVAELDLASRVQFISKVPRNEIPACLRRFDVFLFTSIWPEPLARTIIEAMASGLVVIGSEVGGSREILEQLYDTTLLFQPGNARMLADRIVRVTDEPALRYDLAQRGRQIVLERFTLARKVDEIEAYLLQMCGR